MGKSTVYLNGKQIEEHLGGYLPFSVELTQYGVKAGDTCLLAISTDNSDDKNFPQEKSSRPSILLITEAFTEMCG